MTDRYVDIITRSLADVPRTPELQITTSPVSTFVGGPDAAVPRRWRNQALNARRDGPGTDGQLRALDPAPRRR